MRTRSPPPGGDALYKMRESTRAHESELAFLVRVFGGAAQVVACIDFTLSTSHAAPPSVTSMQSSCGFYRGGKQPSEEDRVNDGLDHM